MQTSQLSPTIALPGRVLTYLNSPEKGTLPHSCTLNVYDNDLATALIITSRDLRNGAGVKFILDNFVARDPQKVDWGFYLDPSHPDYHRMAQEQRQYWVDEGEVGEWIRVNDSMQESGEGLLSIEKSWKWFIDSVKKGHKIIVDLSALRPSGAVNSLGLTATGPLGLQDKENEGSFLAIYEYIAKHLESGDITSFISLLGQLNQTIRRGNQFKDGIVTSSLRYDRPDFRKYLGDRLRHLPGSHTKGVRLDAGVLEHPDLLDLIAIKHNEESVFLEKIQSDPNIHSNVCVGLFLPNRGSCLLVRINLGMCKLPSDIPEAMIGATLFGCDLHVRWRNEVPPEKAALYASLENDRQIGVDVMGLANALANWKVSYLEFTETLEAFLDKKPYDTRSIAGKIVFNLALGYNRSRIVADDFMQSKGLPKLERIHTIEPQQKSAFESKDLKGFPCCRNIDPPFSRRTWRNSEASGRQAVYYGQVEEALSVGAELHQRYCEAWQRLMMVCGRPHSISFDNWQYINREWLIDFMTHSPLQTVYYNFAKEIDQRFLNKGRVAIACEPDKPDECLACAE